ncbi:flagellin lysine-N-methylase [Oribacterium sp. WCC10]|uniref:flagellin lysine-N-methylase n=1 Tax=Oribacterium sp. WCC10 TaxID=1855343 RepID=UPI0008E9851B|nr:flagellin lysine-N-methylase [Oribacterium sp. WCC10]SFG42721.1 lysine-N-methylase [Oribacterium sp. WCC10]
MSLNVIKPDYYDDFHCIGGSCSFTCCQEWKIAVDPETKKRWRSINAPEGLKEAGRLPEWLNEHSCLSKFIVKKDGTDVIGLLRDMTCPFLDSDHLCRLVIDHGEEILSKTCHEFPRENHEYTDRTEKSLVACCPEVVDKWNERNILTFEGLNYRDTEGLKHTKDTLMAARNLIMYLLSDEQCDNRINLLKSFYILLDIYSKESLKDMSDYIDPKVLRELESTIASLERDVSESMVERNELFLDMTENYAAENRYTAFISPLRNLAKELDVNETDMSMYADKENASGKKDDKSDFLSSISKYESLFRNYLVSEAFSGLLIPGMDLRDMVMQFEWMIMEYAIIQQALYLKWKENPEHDLSYETVREMIVLISRLTGYDADDIEDYLESSFESPIWDFGYADFLLG